MVSWLLASLLASGMAQSHETLVFEGRDGPGQGKHIVFLAGDEEYRSEEGLPQLAKILATSHGFKCTVLFSINAKGEIDPDVQTHQPGTHALNSADLCVMLLRFRNWPDEQMKPFVDYYTAGKPIVALRTSTHAFQIPSEATYSRFGWRSQTWPGGFGKQVLGENWVSHWGVHASQATRGLVERAARTHPLLRGVGEIFGDSDVYEASPPDDAEILMRGQVLASMSPGSGPAIGRKKTAAGTEQPLNEPMMPIVWLRRDADHDNTVLTCTMGAATDLLDENLRRLLVNASYWLTDIEVPPRADAALVGKYEPSKFGFGGYRKGVKPADLGTPYASSSANNRR